MVASDDTTLTTYAECCAYICDVGNLSHYRACTHVSDFADRLPLVALFNDGQDVVAQNELTLS